MIEYSRMQSTRVYSGLGHRIFQDMPIDLSSYLLSASPPAFELHYSVRENADEAYSGDPVRTNGVYNAKKNAADRADHKAGGKGVKMNEASARSRLSKAGEEKVYRAFSPKTVSSIDKRTGDEFYEEYNQQECEKLHMQISPESPPGTPPVLPITQTETHLQKSLTKKRVSFADERGKSLYFVRIIHETSDMPPRLSAGIISRLTDNESATVEDIPPLVFKFAQPVSNYLLFYEKLHSNNVCLENAMLKDYAVHGTVKVKNVAFEKSVKIRYTSDGWITFTDKHAVFMSNIVGTTGNFDTFSFDIPIPKSFQDHKNVEFCICYAANGQQYWDNNDGRNYEVAPAQWRVDEQESDMHFSVFDARGFDNKWSEFSIWHHTNNTIPYY